MEIIITGKNIELGESLREHIRDRITPVIERYHGKETTVTLCKERHLIEADITAHITTGVLLQSHDRFEDPYMAFDAALHKLEHRLERYKSRLLKQLHHPSHDTKASVYYVLPHPETHDAHEAPPIIAETSTTIPTLTVADAVMHLDLSGAPVFIFRNSSHEGINIVYHRRDRTIGWVDPDGNRKIHKIKG